jgi:hypothetical protein
MEPFMRYLIATLLLLISCKPQNQFESAVKQSVFSKKPALILNVGADIVASQAPLPFEEYKPISKLIGNIRAVGKAKLNCDLDLNVLPSAQNTITLEIQAVFEVEAKTISSTTSGAGRDVKLHATSYLQGTSTKTMVISSKGVSSNPSKIEISKETTQPNKVLSNRFLWRIKKNAALKQFEENRSKSSAVARGNFTSSIRQEFDQVIDSAIKSFNDKYAASLNKFVMGESIFPGKLFFSSNTEGVLLTVMPFESISQKIKPIQPLSSNRSRLSIQANHHLLNAFFKKTLANKIVPLAQLKSILQQLPIKGLNLNAKSNSVTTGAGDIAELDFEKISLKFGSSPIEVLFKDDHLILNVLMNLLVEDTPPTGLKQYTLSYQILNQNGAYNLSRKSIDIGPPEGKGPSTNQAIIKSPIKSFAASFTAKIERATNQVIDVSVGQYLKTIFAKKVELSAPIILQPASMGAVVKSMTPQKSYLHLNKIKSKDGWFTMEYQHSHSINSSDNQSKKSSGIIKDKKSVPPTTSSPLPLGVCLLNHNAGTQYCHSKLTQNACNSWAKRSKDFKAVWQSNGRCINEYPKINRKTKTRVKCRYVRRPFGRVVKICQ